jgi:hypothetical protein
MMMETYKHQDGQALGSEKVGESSGEGGEKIGDIQAPPKTYHKNAYAHKLNPLRNKLDTNPDPPKLPHSTNDFQKPIKFKRNLGNVFFGKEGEKPSEEKPKPKLVRFHCDYCGKDGHKGDFFFKKKGEERMAKECANKDKYHPSNVVLEPRMPLPKGKAVVRSVLAWGDARSRSRGGLPEKAKQGCGC